MNTQSTTISEVESAPAAVLDLEERQWLPRYCQGDQSAFDSLVRGYGKLVYTFLCRYGVAPQNRDDLFQEIFLKVHQAAASYRPAQPLRPWLISVVLNSVRNARRDSGRRQQMLTQLWRESPFGNPPGDGAQSERQQPSTAGLEDQVEQQSTVLWLEQRIARLAQTQREVLVLSTLQGLSMKEIAKILGLPENTVKTHLRRARLALAESLAARETPAAAAGGCS